ncbi:response regulator [Myxococcota bacterium]
MSAMKSAYCPACGENVEVVVMTMGSGVSAIEAPRCANCGLVLADRPKPLTQAVFPRVAVADDAEALRKAVAEDLRSLRLALTVDLFVDGAQFASAFNARAASGPPFDLVILDLNMPVLDGVKTASFVRNLETQRGWKPVPILFFSALVCDQRLRQALAAMGPSCYLNKGSVGTRANLPKRLETLLRSAFAVGP